MRVHLHDDWRKFFLYIIAIIALLLRLLASVCSLASFIVCVLFVCIISFANSIILQIKFDNLSITKLKISINHFQVSAIYFSFNLGYPKAFLDVVNWVIGLMAFGKLQNGFALFFLNELSSIPLRRH